MDKVQYMREALKNLAVLEAILCPEWEYRYFSYNAFWDKGEEMASMRDGCGSEWFVWFRGDVVAYKCLSKEDGLMQNIDDAKSQFPTAFSDFINEPAFSMQSATCIWYNEASQWKKFGKDVIYSLGIEQILSWGAEEYSAWATEYYEREIPGHLVEKILSGQRNKSLALELNPELDWGEFIAEMNALGI